MSFVSVPRSVYTLPEISKRWSVSALDVRRALVDGHLKACVMLDDDLEPVTVVDGVATVLPDVAPVRVRKYLYPVFGLQISPFDLRHEILCDMPLPVEGCQLYRLPNPVTLEGLMGIAVVTADDLAEAEAALRTAKDEDELTAKERNSISIILTTLYFDAHGWKPDDGRCPGIAEIVRNAESLGLRITENTVRKVVNECWARAKPNLN